MYRRVSQCRICGNPHLIPILDLGLQMLTGVFPDSVNPQAATIGPLRLVKCMGEDTCGLVQLEHSYDLEEMYGENYGYRSGLNKSMADHLQNKVKKLLQYISLSAGDLVIDVGSNDSTTLQAYDASNLTLVGIDPTGTKFASFYPPNITLIPEFFSSKLIHSFFPNRKAKVITSFSMFYDLENPLEFMQQVHSILDDEGIWVFEQSYLPTMLHTNSFDTVCHEHLEFYALKQIQWMAEKVGFLILDVEFNDVNGGSFSVMVRKKKTGETVLPTITALLEEEAALGLDTLEPFLAFAKRAAEARTNLFNYLAQLKKAGKSIAALGASTKGNVLLQYCGLSADELMAVGEVNPEKFGRYTPGSWIPIVNEDQLLANLPDYLLVLPWHFKSFFLNNPKFRNTKLIFPLPMLEVIE